MSEIIDDISYTLVLIIMFSLIVIYGGSKKHNNLQIEYDSKNYKYLNSLTIFEKQLQQYNSSNFDYLQITNKINLSECLIPNIIDIFFVNLKPYSYFNTNNFVKNKISNLMVLYVHSLTNTSDNNTNIKNNNPNLSLLINKKKECIKNNCTNYGYYYDINNKISIFDVYPIYNNSNFIVNISIFIIKKSFWHF
jgi:hypothetical protein